MNRAEPTLKTLFDKVNKARRLKLSEYTFALYMLNILSEIRTPAWNNSCIEHSKQTAALARIIANKIPSCRRNKEAIASMGLLHDIGCCVSQDKWIHGLAGSLFLAELNFPLSYSNIAYTHLEAGAPLLGATPENWSQILAADNLREEIDSLYLPDVIIAVADMAKIGIETPPGSGQFVNELSDPLEGVFVSGLRRLPEDRAKAVQEANINLCEIGGPEDLQRIHGIDPQIGLYLGLCWLLKDRLMHEGVLFKNAIEQAKADLRLSGQ